MAAQRTTEEGSGEAIQLRRDLSAWSAPLPSCFPGLPLPSAHWDGPGKPPGNCLGDFGFHGGEDSFSEELEDTGLGFGAVGHREFSCSHFPAERKGIVGVLVPGRLEEELPSTLKSKECVLTKRKLPGRFFLLHSWPGESKQIFSFVT